MANDENDNGAATPTNQGPGFGDGDAYVTLAELESTQPELAAGIKQRMDAMANVGERDGGEVGREVVEIFEKILARAQDPELTLAEARHEIAQAGFYGVLLCSKLIHDNPQTTILGADGAPVH